jgi:hypothetical protein
MIGRDLSKAMRIESRQHEILGLDLGEGIRRRLLGLGALAFAVWVPIAAILMFGVFRLPFSADLVTVFLAPPIALLMIGFQEDQTIPHRLRVTSFSLRMHRIFKGGTPLINLGAGRASRHERLTLAERMSSAPAGDEIATAPPAMHLAFKARVYGEDYLLRILADKKGTNK